MASKPEHPSIGEHFDLHPDRPLPGAGGGLDAYGVTDRRGVGETLMAVRVPDGQAPRILPAGAFEAWSVPFCLTPVGHGVGHDDQGRRAQFVICPAPPGPSLQEVAAGRPWSEAELLHTLLQPVAAALASLQARQLTHRAIRPDNVFQAARGQPVTLGCAWATSPARHQPAAYEPPYSAICQPAWRDDGVIADDVYALGVLMVALATGSVPLAGLDSRAVVTRKIAIGSVAAILGTLRLPPIIADLAHGMLAEDPDHRPSPGLLADPEAARARRVAARPRRRAQRSIQVGAHGVWDGRGLAHALATEPVQAIQVLRSGRVDQWLRRSLGDVSLALILEEAVRQRAAETLLDESGADAILLLRAVAALDPLAPLCWMGLHLCPGAFGSALAAASPDEVAALGRMLEVEAFAARAFARAQRCDPVRAQAEARKLRAMARHPGWAGGMVRLRYASNPLLPCRSPLLEGATVVGLADLLPALERTAERMDRPVLPFDAELAAFVAARLGTNMEADFTLMGRASAEVAALAQLRVLARVQGRQPMVPPLPRLAAWLATGCAPILSRIRGRARLASVRATLDQQVATGRLASVLAVFDNRAILEADVRDAAAAEAAMVRVDADIATVERRLDVTRGDAHRLGREIVASIGLVTVAAVTVWMAL